MSLCQWALREKDDRHSIAMLVVVPWVGWVGLGSEGAVDHHGAGVVGGKEKDVSMRMQLIRCRDVLIELADHRQQGP